MIPIAFTADMHTDLPEEDYTWWYEWLINNNLTWVQEMYFFGGPWVYVQYPIFCRVKKDTYQSYSDPFKGTLIESTWFMHLLDYPIEQDEVLMEKLANLPVKGKDYDFRWIKSYHETNRSVKTQKDN